MKIKMTQALSCLSVIPQRYLFTFIGFLMTFVGGMLRLTVNLTLSRMVNLTSNVICNHPDICPVSHLAVSDSGLNHRGDEEMYPFDWDDRIIFSIIGKFFFGYVIAEYLAGNVAMKNGGKGIIGFALLVSSLATILGPIVATTVGQNGMQFLQFHSGLGQGSILPALVVMVGYWAPVAERARLGAIIFSGTHIGFIAGIYLSKLILAHGRWDIVYYVFGVIGLIQCSIWYLFCYSTPNTHPFISKKEKIFLNESINVLIRSEQYKIEPFPWKAVLRSTPIWAICFGDLGNKLAYQTVTLLLPTFLSDIQKNKEVNLSNKIPIVPFFLISISTICFGFICDYGIKLGFHSITWARKVYTTIGALVPVICIVIAAYSSDNTILVIFCINISMVFLGAYYSGMMIAPLDVAPNYCGPVFALVDSNANNIVRLLLPTFVRSVVIEETLIQWRIVLLACVALICITTIISVKCILVKQVWWDDVRQYGYPFDWKHGFFPANGVIDLKMIEEGNKVAFKNINDEL